MAGIRCYREGDAKPISRVFQSSIRGIAPADYSIAQVDAWITNAPTEEQIIARCTDGRLTLVAVNRHEEIIAYIDLEAHGHIDHLYCSPVASRSGVALSLYSTVEAHAHKQGLKQLFTEASEAAKRFFERQGFRTIARRDLNLQEVAIHNYSMEKQLDLPRGIA